MVAAQGYLFVSRFAGRCFCSQMRFLPALVDLVWLSLKYFSSQLLGNVAVFLSKDHFYTDFGTFDSNSHHETERNGDVFYYYSLYSNQLGVVITPQRLGHLADIMTEKSLIAVINPTGTVV